MDEKQLLAALRQAHAAGDTQTAERITAEIITLRQSGPAANFQGVQSGSSSQPATPQVSEHRLRGRESEQWEGPAGAAVQGFGSMMFGAGTPVTALTEYVAGLVNPNRERMSFPESMEFARGVRENAAEENPAAYYAGSAGGLAGGIGLAKAATKSVPKIAQTVFSPQNGQTIRNLMRMSAQGGVAGGVTAGNEQGVGSIKTGAVVGAAAAPALVGGMAAGKWGFNRVSANTQAIKILSERLGESADELAAKYNDFLKHIGHPPRLIDIASKSGAEELGEVASSRWVGTGASRVFREGEEQASEALQHELPQLMRAAPRTTPAAASTVAAQDAIAGTIRGDAADVARKRVTTSPKRQRDVRDRLTTEAMGPIRDHKVAVTPEMLEVLEHSDVTSTLDGAVRRRLQKAITEGAEIGHISLPVVTWDMIRQDLSKKAGNPGAGTIYARLRDKVRDYVSDVVPEYGEVMVQFGHRSDIAKGVRAGASVISARTRAFVDNMAAANTRVRTGARVGARTEIREALTGTVEGADRFMKRLSGDANLRARVRESLRPDEAAELEQLAGHYGHRLNIREGVDIGSRVAAGGDTNAFKDAVENASEVGREIGVPAGARSTLESLAGESPGSAQGLSESLARNKGLQDRLTAALGGEEAGRLKKVGTLMANASSNRATVSPSITQARQRNQQAAQKIQSVIAGGVMVGTTRASAAFQSNVVLDLVQRLRISKKGATRMAEMMMDPDNADAVIARLGSAGLSADEIADIYQGAAVAAGIIAGHAR